MSAPATPQAPTATDDAVRLAELRALAETKPQAARTAAWTWLTSLDTGKDADRLDALFRLSTAPAAIDGDGEGAVLGLFGTPFMGFVDRAVRLGRVLGGIGWTGKSFDGQAGTGYNRLTRTARLPMFVVMPRYGFSVRGGELIGFRFDHRVEPSPADPDLEVRAVIYENPAYGNPLMLPRTRDELVELVPGCMLGRALLQPEGGPWETIAYFALRFPREDR